MSVSLVDRLRSAVQEALDVEVASMQVVRGGDVASAHRLVLDDGRAVFAKTHPDPPPGFFTTEAAGLSWLSEPDVVAVPQVLAVSDGASPSTGGDGDDGVDAMERQLGHPAFLVLEWIDEGRPAARSEAELGRSLAALHLAGAVCFGREDRRTTGSRALPNEPTATWPEFYATQRLLPLARLAADARALSAETLRRLERLATSGVLTSLPGAEEPASRLHGDLWAGNRLVDASGTSWLIDPAAHGGHREFDLAMMRLFGGFGSEFFAAYDDAFPLAEGWADRVSLHQVAPLVVHAVKFGGGYVASATEAIERWT